jgi:hypothetical protein
VRFEQFRLAADLCRNGPPSAREFVSIPRVVAPLGRSRPAINRRLRRDWAIVRQPKSARSAYVRTPLGLAPHHLR